MLRKELEILKIAAKALQPVDMDRKTYALGVVDGIHKAMEILEEYWEDQEAKSE